MPAVQVDGLRVEYTDCGVGLPLVFVPGLYGSADWFRYQASGLSDRYRVIAYTTRTVRGHADYSLALLADDLVRFLDKLKIYEAVIVGHTLGASVAFTLAAQFPERVLATVAVSTVTSYAGAVDTDVLAHLSPGEAEPETFVTRVMNWFGRGPAIVEDEANPLGGLIQRVDKATLSARLHLLMAEDITPILPDIEAPALVVVGSTDWSRILRGSQTIDQLVPKASLEVIEDADHFCFYTRHDLFNAVLDDFVSREVPRL